MANLKASKKDIKVNKKRNLINRVRKSQIKTLVRKVNTAISTNNVDEIKKAFVALESKLMKSVQKGTFKKNTATRKLSRLAKKIKKSKETKN